MGDSHLQASDIPNLCPAHSGQSQRLNVNLVINGIGTLLIGCLLVVALQIQGQIASNMATIGGIQRQLDGITRDIAGIDNRLRALELGQSDAR